MNIQQLDFFFGIQIQKLYYKIFKYTPFKKEH